MTGVNLGTLFAKLLLEDDFSGTFQKYLAEQDKALQKQQAVSNGFKIAGAAAVAFGTAAVGAANNLNKSMANIATLIPGNTKRVEELKGALQGLSTDLGRSTDDLAGGLYELMSTLGDTADNVKILEINAKAAAAGLATTQDAINFTTAVTKTYGDTSAEAFQKVSDLGFQTVNLGKTTFPELAQAIGRVAPLAKETGVSMEEMFAVVATATGITGNTNEVMTQMAAAITAVVSPSADLADVYQKMGVKSGEALIKQEGLVGALQKIAGAAKEADKPLIDLLGRKEAWIITSALAGSQADSFSQKMKSMGNVVGATETALEQQTQGIAKSAHEWERWKARATVALQNVGDGILGTLHPALQTAAVGFSEMGGSAIASAGELAQVAIAAKMLGGGQILSSVGALAGRLTGVTSAAASARFGLIGVGVAVAAWSLAKVYEALSLMSEISKQAEDNADDLERHTKQNAQMIAVANEKIGVSAKNAGEAFQLLTFYSAGLRGQLPQNVEWTDNLRIAFEKGAKAGKSFAEQSNSVMITTHSVKNAVKEIKPHIDTMVDQYARLQKEVAGLSGEQRRQIVAGKEMGLNTKQISDELMKLPNAVKVSEAAIDLFTRSQTEATKQTKDTTEEIKKLKDEMMGLGSIKDATNLSNIIGSNANLLDPQQIEGALTTLRSALDTVNRLGASSAGATDSQIEGWTATVKVLEKARNTYEDLDAEMRGLAAGGVKKVDDRVSHFTETSEELNKELKKLKDRMSDRNFASGLSDEFKEVVSRTRNFINELDDLQYAIDSETNPAIRDMRIELRNLRGEDMAQELGEMTFKTLEFKAVLVSLLPLVPSLAGAIGEVGDASAESEGKARRFRGEIKSLKDALTGEIGGDFFNQLIGSMVDGFSSGGSNLEVFRSAGKAISDQLARGIQASAMASIGGVAGGIASAGAGLIIGLFADQMIKFAMESETKAKMREAADQMRTQLIEQMANGNRAAFIEMLKRAGQTAREIQVILETGNPEQLASTWGGAADALQRYNNELKNLGQMAGGAGMIGESLGKRLGASKAEQEKPFLAMQEAAIEAMKKAGAAQSEIDAQLAAFTEQNKNRTYVATEEQIAMYNRLGTITGGIIANMAGRTGDLIGAVLANKDAIQQLIDAQQNFGLGEQTTAATQQVIDLYKTMIENEDVMLSLQGTTQGLQGMSDAMLRNADLANAFGGQLAADLATLQERGVDTAHAFAMAAPALQRLWELQKEGKVALDETTTAMLAQAEQQGIVGESMRNVNDQILNVLKDIRDMFSKEIPSAVPRTTAAVREGANAQQRAANDTARAWKDGTYDVEETWRRNQERMRVESAETAIKVRENLSSIPNDFPVDVRWKVPGLELPPPPKYTVPVEFEHPDPVWKEGYTPGSQNEQTAGYNGASMSIPGGDIEGGRGSQTIIVERDGQRDLQFTAENLPDYVRLRAGNTVLGV